MASVPPPLLLVNGKGKKKKKIFEILTGAAADGLFGPFLSAIPKTISSISAPASFLCKFFLKEGGAGQGEQIVPAADKPISLFFPPE